MSSAASTDIGRFPLTQWALVEGASHPELAPGREALTELLRLYLPALRVHLLRKPGISVDLADDLLQSFLTDKVLEQNLAGLADRGRGKFRNFLVMALDNYVRNVLMYQKAMKRASRAGALPFDAVLASEAVSGIDLDVHFNVVWARELLAQTTEAMRVECERRGRADVWEVFCCRIYWPAMRNTAPDTYEELAARLNLPSPMATANLLVTAKRMYQRMLRKVVGQYAGHDGDAEEEVRDLLAILSQSGTTSRA